MDQIQPTLLYSKRTLLSLAVIIVSLAVGLYWLRFNNYPDKQSRTPADNERNERSTPRSFVLPATPAVALEQEMRSAKSFSTTMSKRQVAACALRLIDLGYDVGDEAVAFNAKLSQAIYEYQQAQGLNKTGKFDPATTRSLSCSVK
jgi:hypothetical protein